MWLCVSLILCHLATCFEFTAIRKSFVSLSPLMHLLPSKSTASVMLVIASRSKQDSYSVLQDISPPRKHSNV
ncbi:hypothetical protein CC78DRAFT_534340 [Lojkania enalia]|uniref:Secreted protein n=1 Tax=Lojkania enalia TaxID=147567 RepID=A0A9P4K6N7_9PLEO|nr:hypothetical protein CC78DRAFT_534340 [Didymosphaeria enalia]